MIHANAGRNIHIRMQPGHRVIAPAEPVSITAASRRSSGTMPDRRSNRYETASYLDFPPSAAAWFPDFLPN